MSIKPSMGTLFSGAVLYEFHQLEFLQENAKKTVAGRIKAIAFCIFVAFPTLTVTAAIDFTVAILPITIVADLVQNNGVYTVKRLTSSVALPIIALFGAFIGRVPEFSIREVKLMDVLNNYTPFSYNPTEQHLKYIEFLLDHGKTFDESQSRYIKPCVMKVLLEKSKTNSHFYTGQASLGETFILTIENYRIEELTDEQMEILEASINYMKDRGEKFKLESILQIKSAPFLKWLWVKSLENNNLFDVGKFTMTEVILFSLLRSGFCPYYRNDFTKFYTPPEGIASFAQELIDHGDFNSEDFENFFKVLNNTIEFDLKYVFNQKYINVSSEQYYLPEASQEKHDIFEQIQSLRDNRFFALAQPHGSFQAWMEIKDWTEVGKFRLTSFGSSNLKNVISTMLQCYKKAKDQRTEETIKSVQNISNSHVSDNILNIIKNY